MRDVCWWGLTYLTPAMSQMRVGFSAQMAGLLVGLISVTGVISQPLAGTVPVVDAAAAEIVPPSMRGRLFGITLTLGLLIGALSPYAVGILYDATESYTIPYLFMGVSALVGAVLALMIPSKKV
jgi:hypothetical protein